LAEGAGTMEQRDVRNERHQTTRRWVRSGAGEGFAGADVVQTHMTNSRLTDPEVLETRYPVLVESFAIRRGSGGRALVRRRRCHPRIRFREAMRVSTLSGHPPPAAVRRRRW